MIPGTILVAISIFHLIAWLENGSWSSVVRDTISISFPGTPKGYTVVMAMLDTSVQTAAYIVAYTTFFIGLLSVILRIYCRLHVLKAWGWDDHIAVFVGAVSCGQQAILHLFLFWGCGLHMDSLSGKQQLKVIETLFIEEVYYYFVHWVIKCAFLFFYLRLSPDQTFQKCVYIGMGANFTIFIINVLIAIFQCIPFDEIFHPGTHPDAKCLPKIVLLVVPSILNILMDFFILILPISTVLNLQITRRRKIAVIAVVGFGASAVMVACFRLIPLFELNSSLDVSYVLGKMVIVAAVEIQLAVVAVNLPSLKALWVRMLGDESIGSGRPYGNKKDYKLRSIGRGTVDASSGGESSRRLGKSRIALGSITRMEHGVKGSASEEELFDQARGTVAQGSDSSRGDI